MLAQAMNKNSTRYVCIRVTGVTDWLRIKRGDLDHSIYCHLENGFMNSSKWRKKAWDKRRTMRLDQCYGDRKRGKVHDILLNLEQNNIKSNLSKTKVNEVEAVSMEVVYS